MNKVAICLVDIVCYNTQTYGSSTDGYILLRSL